ncbi:MAG: hypothetical protein NW208_09065 [Bryobacter sp.]|nr:hypothetical protein [Bryobacter sp.]
MLHSETLPQQTSWKSEVETELRLLHRRKQAINQLIRALEEYAVVGCSSGPLAAAADLVEARMGVKESDSPYAHPGMLAQRRLLA